VTGSDWLNLCYVITSNSLFANHARCCRKLIQLKARAEAILPGVALAELWEMMGALEQVLALIAMLVLLASLLGMSIMLLSTMSQRQREIAVMRAMGAYSSFIFLLVELEAVFIAVAGILLGIGCLQLGLYLGSDWLSSRYGLFMERSVFNETTLYFSGAILAGAALLAMLPAVVAYRGSLAKGLHPG
jgi:putative ABC transport system permease protein